MMTPRQKAFAANLAKGMSASDAARASGYSDNSEGGLRTTGSRLLNDPRIQQAAFLERERILNGSLASRALKTLGDVMDDQTAPPAARIQAARFILESAGHGVANKALAARHPEEGGKSISQYTTAELEEFVRLASENLRQAHGRVIDMDSDPQTDPADKESE
jgi:hypothetical protein